MIYDFTKLLTIENLEKCVTPLQIFQFYIPGIKIGDVINSPIRRDSNPSFGILIHYSGNVIYNDLATKDSGNWIKFVQKKFSLKNINDVLVKVNNDMQLGLYSDKYIETTEMVILPEKTVIKPKSNTIIKVKHRNWNKDDADFWTRYGITSKQLIKSKTFPISHYWINGSRTIVADKHAYVYYFYEYQDVMLMKIYQPYSTTNKWYTNLNKLTVDGIKELQPSDSLIITKSRKDRLVLNNLGYQSISVNSESTFIPISVFEKLQVRYDDIMVMFDADKAGIENSKKVSDLYNIKSLSIPEQYGEKDISDFWKRYGKVKSKELITKLIN